MLTLKQKLVLLALRNNCFTYGAIIEAIELGSMGKHKFSSELRPLVKHMDKVGLIQSQYGELKHSYRIDTRRKYYSITNKGLAVLERKDAD